MDNTKQLSPFILGVPLRRQPPSPKWLCRLKSFVGSGYPLNLFCTQKRISLLSLTQKPVILEA